MIDVCIRMPANDLEQELCQVSPVPTVAKVWAFGELSKNVQKMQSE